MDLTSLTKPLSKPPIITIVGTPGVGKSTLGALFPNPIFIQAEEGSSVFDSWAEEDKPTVFPVLPRANAKEKISTLEALKDQLRALIKQDHDFKTLVLDSVTSLHNLFEHEVADAYGVDNVADAAGGFHKGYLVVKEYHQEIKSACDYLRDKKGMTIVFLAHAGVEKVKNRPDADEYSVYSLDMNKQSVSVYVALVDAVLYLRQEEFVKGVQTDRKGVTTKFGKVVQTGERILVTSGDGRVGFVNAKSRYPMDAEVPVPIGENPLLKLIPYFSK